MDTKLSVKEVDDKHSNASWHIIANVKGETVFDCVLYRDDHLEDIIGIAMEEMKEKEINTMGDLFG